MDRAPLPLNNRVITPWVNGGWQAGDKLTLEGVLQHCQQLYVKQVPELSFKTHMPVQVRLSLASCGELMPSGLSAGQHE